MIKLRHRSFDEWIFIWYIMLLPILPEYFRVAGSPVFVFIGIFPVLFLILKDSRKGLKLDKAYVQVIAPIFLLAVISYGAHSEFSSLARYIMFPVVSTYLIRKYVKDEEQVYDVFRIMVYVGFVMCLFGLIEKLFGYNVFSIIENVADYGKTGTQPSYRNGVARVELSFGNPISAALYMIFINCLAFTLWRKQGITKNVKRISLATYVLSFLIIILTDSRMCIITVLLMQVLFFMRERWSKRAAILIALISVIAIDFAIGGFISQYLGKYITFIADILQNGSNTSDTNTLYRFELIPVFLPMIRERFFFGYGNEFLNGYRFGILNGYAYSIDNMYLETFVRHGLFGFSIVIIPIIYMFSFSKKIKNTSREMSYNFTWMTIIYLINLISVAQLGEQRLFYLIWGLMLSYCYMNRPENKYNNKSMN